MRDSGPESKQRARPLVSFVMLGLIAAGVPIAACSDENSAETVDTGSLSVETERSVDDASTEESETAIVSSSSQPAASVEEVTVSSSIEVTPQAEYQPAATGEVPTLTVTIDDPSTVAVIGDDGFTTAWLSLDSGTHEYPVPATLGASVEYAIISVSEDSSTGRTTTAQLDHPAAGTERLEVYVTDRESQPVANASVEVAGGQDFTTNDQGISEHIGLPAGLVQLRVEADGYLPLRTTASTTEPAVVVELDELDPDEAQLVEPGRTTTVNDLGITLSGESEVTRIWVIDDPVPGGFADPWGIMVADIVPEQPVLSPVTITMPVPEALMSSLGDVPEQLTLVQLDTASGRRRIVNGLVSGTPPHIEVTVPDLIGDKFTYYSGGFRVGTTLSESEEFTSTLLEPPVTCSESYQLLTAEVETTGSGYTYDLSPLPDIENAPYITTLTASLGGGPESRRISMLIPKDFDGGLYAHKTAVSINATVWLALDNHPLNGWEPERGSMTDEEVARAMFSPFAEIPASAVPWDAWVQITTLNETYEKVVASAFDSPYAARPRPGDCAGEEPVCFWAPSNGVAFYGEEATPAPDDPDCTGVQPEEFWMTPAECWDAYVEWFEWAVDAEVSWEIQFPESPCGRDALPLPE